MTLRRTIPSLALAVGLVLGLTGRAEARGPYVVLKDDGTLAGKVTDPYATLDAVMKLYDATGQPRPDVLSVWTAFTMDKSDFGTLFDPASNDVKGIGLDNEYPGDGTFESDYPPLRAMLLHNNVLALDKRATLQAAPTQNFGDYIFLLELSHVWGPAARVPVVVDSGTQAKDDLIGFSFHWSFWMDSGGSPAGGNRWKDNGDGTFTVAPQSPTDITYSMLDLYLMGLADASEVPPFGLLENAVPPADKTDPFTKKAFSRASFPWFGTDAFTATATRRTITVQDIITANGPRTPAKGVSPTSFKLGIALVVKPTATDDEIAAAEAAMDPVAVRLAPAFERATRGRGHMEVVTKAPEPEPDAGVEEDAGPPPPPPSTTIDGDGCATAPSSPADHAPGAALLLGLVAVFARFGLRRRR